MKSISLKQGGDSCCAVPTPVDPNSGKAWYPRLYVDKMPSGLKCGQTVTITGVVIESKERQRTEGEEVEKSCGCEIECREITPGKEAKKSEMASDEEAVAKGLDAEMESEEEDAGEDKEE